jgi:hypothetical protein
LNIVDVRIVAEGKLLEDLKLLLLLLHITLAVLVDNRSIRGVLKVSSNLLYSVIILLPVNLLQRFAHGVFK